MERAGVEPADVGYVVIGEVLQAGVGMIPSRQVSAGIGMPKEVGSETINKVCASGLRAVNYGDLLIRALPELAGELKYHAHRCFLPSM